MKCIVTGGAGFIGSHLVEELCNLGHEVVAVDNLSAGFETNLLAAQRAKLVIAEADETSYGGADVVFHLAAVPCVQSSIRDSRSSFKNNLQLSQRVYEACLNNNVGRVVTASSAAVYGDKQEMPLNENDVLQPQSPYGAAKACCDMLVSSYAKCYETDFVDLRFFNVYGPRQSVTSPYSGAIGKLCRCAVSGSEFTLFGDGFQTRDFVYVKDVINGLILSGTCLDRLGGVSMNIGTGRETSMCDLISTIQEMKPVKVIHGEAKIEPRRSVADIALATKKIKYQPSWTIRNGLEQTLAWYEKTKQ